MNKRKTSFILATALAASIIMSGCASTAVSGSDSSSTATQESATAETALDIDYSVGLARMVITRMLRPRRLLLCRMIIAT